jgi:hypothetical protein
MVKMSFPAALGELRVRNDKLSAAYREWGRRLPPGAASRLAASVAGQRKELGDYLAEASANRALSNVMVEFESSPSGATGHDAEPNLPPDQNDLLRRMAEAEEAEHELLAAVAGAVLPASGAVAERLASEADSARKRSFWARDQLELLGL